MDFNTYWAEMNNVGNRDSSEKYYRLKGLERNAIIEIFGGGHGKIADLGCGSGELTYELLNLRDNEFVGIDISKSLIDDAQIRLKSFGERVHLFYGDALSLLKKLDSSIWISSGALGQYWDKRQINELIDIFLANESAKELHLFDCIDPIRLRLLRSGLLSYRKENKRSLKIFIKKCLGLLSIFKNQTALDKDYIHIGKMGYAILPSYWLELAKEKGLDVQLLSSLHYEYRYHVSFKKK